MQTTSYATKDILQDFEELKKKYQLLEKKEQYFRVLTAFTTSMMVQDSIEGVVWDIAKNAIARLGYEDCVIYLLDNSGEYLIQRAAHGPKNPIELDIKNPIKIKVGEGIVGTVAKTGIPEIIYDTRQDDRYIIDDESRHSEIAVPIINTSKEVIGVIDSEHPNSHFYSEADLVILKAIASIAATKLSQVTIQEKLKSSNNDLKQFAYITSHDLQEPLRMVGSFAQLIERRYSNILDETGKKYLGFLTEGAQRMSILVREILEYSTINKNEEPFQSVDCQDVLNEVLKNLNIQIETEYAKIETDKLPEIRGQFSQLVQLFQNIIGNAIKFRSTKPPYIQISVKKEYAFYKFSVADNGIGIAEEFRHKIFDIFRRLNKRSEFEGTGIGLAICKKIVEKLGGKIWVDGNEMGGSTFYFTIPTKA